MQETQPDEWAYLQGLQKDKAEQTLIEDLCRALDSQQEGCLSVLRHGFKCFDKLFRTAYFAPASGMNPEAEGRFAANRLAITRQVRYSTRHANTLDVVLVLNGIPIITVELKNPMTGQTWRDAVRQYKHDRDPADLLFQFKKRALVHFAVDPAEVRMTTRLAGRNTHFLSFNKGRAGGAGNPENPGGWKTAYLWEEVLERRSLLDILARVWDRLLLRVGVVGFPRKLPYQAVVEAARNVEDDLVRVEQEMWRVRDARTLDGATTLSVVRQDGEHQLIAVPVALRDGRPDVSYPYCAVDDAQLRESHDFSAPRPAPLHRSTRQTYRWVPELRTGDAVRVRPSRVARLFLGSTARHSSRNSGVAPPRAEAGHGEQT